MKIKILSLITILLITAVNGYASFTPDNPMQTANIQSFDETNNIIYISDSAFNYQKTGEGTNNDTLIITYSDQIELIPSSSASLQLNIPDTTTTTTDDYITINASQMIYNLNTSIVLTTYDSNNASTIDRYTFNLNLVRNSPNTPVATDITCGSTTLTQINIIYQENLYKNNLLTNYKVIAYEDTNKYDAGILLYVCER